MSVISDYMLMCVSFSVHDFFVGVICFLEPVVLSIIKICCWAYKKKDMLLVACNTSDLSISLYI